MKKIFVVLGIILVTITGSVFAQNLQVPDETVDSISTGNLQVPVKYYLGEKYAKEINKKIDKEYFNIIKKITNAESEIINEQDPYNKEAILDMGIDTPVFYLLVDLIDITEKYAGKDNELGDLATDYSGTLYDAVYPYFVANDINIEKIDKLMTYSAEMQNVLAKKYSKWIWQLKSEHDKQIP